MQALSVPAAAPLLQSAEGVPCTSGLLDGPAALTALLLRQGMRSKAAVAAVQVLRAGLLERAQHACADMPLHRHRVQHMLPGAYHCGRFQKPC